jgi:hypothetical protein
MISTYPTCKAADLLHFGTAEEPLKALTATAAPTALITSPVTRSKFSEKVVLLPPSLIRPLFSPATSEWAASYPAEAATTQAGAPGPQARPVSRTVLDFVAPVKQVR